MRYVDLSLSEILQSQNNLLFQVIVSPVTVTAWVRVSWARLDAVSSTSIVQTDSVTAGSTEHIVPIPATQNV